MQTRSLRKFHDALFAAKAPLVKECARTFPLSSLLSHTAALQRRAQAAGKAEREQSANGCSPCCMGSYIYKHASGRGEGESTNGDEEREVKGKIGVSIA